MVVPKGCLAANGLELLATFDAPRPIADELIVDDSDLVRRFHVVLLGITRLFASRHETVCMRIVERRAVLSTTPFLKATRLEMGFLLGFPFLNVLFMCKKRLFGARVD